MSAPLISRLEWQGIGIEVRYTPNRFEIGCDHIELHADDKKRIPVTETGYRSHFIHRSAIEPFGSAEAYVRTWLDQEAQSPSWRTYVEASRQLTLF
jgi:hypothetical protein